MNNLYKFEVNLSAINKGKNLILILILFSLFYFYFSLSLQYIYIIFFNRHIFYYFIIILCSYFTKKIFIFKDLCDLKL